MSYMYTIKGLLSSYLAHIIMETVLSAKVGDNFLYDSFCNAFLSLKTKLVYVH